MLATERLHVPFCAFLGPAVACLFFLVIVQAILVQAIVTHITEADFLLSDFLAEVRELRKSNDMSLLLTERL